MGTWLAVSPWRFYMKTSNPRPGTPVSSNPWDKALIFCVGLLAVSCFFAGRASVHQTAAAPTNPKIAMSPDRPATIAKSTVDFTPLVLPNPQPVKVVTDASGWDEQKWADLASQPGNPARNAALAAMLEKLAAVDPDRAMTLAQAQDNLKLRGELVQASLHGWARTSPTNAANWALGLADPNEREKSISTVFAGAVAADPDQAVLLGKFVVAQNPEEALGYGSSLIDALCAGGDFDKAAHMAADGNGGTQSPWMSEAYSKWAEFQPEQAGEAAENIADPALRSEALHGIVGGGAEVDPAGLVNFVMQLPSDTDRDSLLSQSLETWARQDPIAASQWMNNHGPGPDLDQGEAAIATSDPGNPQVGIQWAENVADPTLRSETLASVLRNWLAVDPGSAENYFDSTQNLLPNDRQEIADVIATLKGQTASE
jgi:hypothetical protein